MAFSYTVNDALPGACGLGFKTGTFTSDGASTGGAITTGLHEILYFKANCGKTAAGTQNLVSLSGGIATITTVANETGEWLAVGS